VKGKRDGEYLELPQNLPEGGGGTREKHEDFQSEQSVSRHNFNSRHSPNTSRKNNLDSAVSVAT
jgi:hypothetical protein